MRLTQYICELCNKQFERKDSYDKHLNRKFSCIPNSIKPNRLDILENDKEEMSKRIEELERKIELLLSKESK